MLKKLPVTVQALIISIVFFLIHFGIVTFLNKIDTIPFLMSYAFLGLSALKVGISYFFATEYLFQNKVMLETNKINFFITFLFFLSLDVYFTIRLLNKK